MSEQEARADQLSASDIDQHNQTCAKEISSAELMRHGAEKRTVIGFLTDLGLFSPPNDSVDREQDNDDVEEEAPHRTSVYP